MEYLKIISDIIGHIAWPIIFLLVVRELKGELRNLLRRVKNAKYKGVEINLSRELEETKTAVQVAGIDIYSAVGSLPIAEVKEASESPEWALIKSSREIGKLIEDLYKKYNGVLSDPGGEAEALQSLVKDGHLKSEMRMAIVKLKSVRNKIVHSKNVSATKGEALEWLDLSNKVIGKLKSQLQGVPEPA